jgi:hypothetical protein
VTWILDAEIVVPAQCELAEGPAWDASDRKPDPCPT